MTEQKSLLKYDSIQHQRIRYYRFEDPALTVFFHCRSKSMTSMEAQQDDLSGFMPDLPIAISCIGGHYLLFDIKTASWLRREHNLCGYNVGTLPQSPSQNVFLGLPIMIMPEEAQILLDKGVGYILDDARAHDQALYDRNSKSKADYTAKVHRQATEVGRMRAQEHAEARDRALSKQKSKAKPKPTSAGPEIEATLLDFDNPSPPTPTNPEPTQDIPTKSTSQSYHITPTTSTLLLTTTTPPTTTALATKHLPGLPSTYPLFRHLHSLGYFMTPGLRFGCRYSTYPGDPLRFHSHFLTVGLEWEQEVDLMDIVGGARLGTAVKKGFLLGAVEPGKDGEEEGRVRTFSVEWAVM